MATPAAWHLQVDDRIEKIANELKSNPDFSHKEVPGLRSLLDDYIAPDVEVDKVNFAQRLLKVFKDSETDDTYQDLLAKHTQNEQDRIEKFVAGEDLNQTSQGFVMGPSLGCREELEKMQQAPAVAHVSSRKGVEKIKEPKFQVAEEEHSWFHKTIHKLADFFGIHHEDDESRILVCRSLFTLWLCIHRAAGLSKCRIPKLGSQRPKYTKSDLVRFYDLWSSP